MYIATNTNRLIAYHLNAVNENISDLPWAFLQIMTGTRVGKLLQQLPSYQVQLQGLSY